MSSFRTQRQREHRRAVRAARRNAFRQKVESPPERQEAADRVASSLQAEDTEHRTVTEWARVTGSKPADVRAWAAGKRLPNARQTALILAATS